MTKPESIPAIWKSKPQPRCDYWPKKEEEALKSQSLCSFETLPPDLICFSESTRLFELA